jgi:hypothetical protein
VPYPAWTSGGVVMPDSGDSPGRVRSSSAQMGSVAGSRPGRRVGAGRGVEGDRADLLCRAERMAGPKRKKGLKKKIKNFFLFL